MIDRRQNGSRSHKDALRKGDVPGIVIQDGGQGHEAALKAPRVSAFIYGEKLPASPTLPFGRWKSAS
jgi:hypothetical protein